MRTAEELKFHVHCPLIHKEEEVMFTEAVQQSILACDHGHKQMQKLKFVRETHDISHSRMLLA